MSKPENPLLFEYEYDGQNNVLHSSAITLRDLFAALQPVPWFVTLWFSGRFNARYRYERADAMLAEREERSDG